MREIKFRGKRVDYCKWVYGFYYQYKMESGKIINYITTDKRDTHQIIEETICQFTGLKDKNCAEIYEGDIIQSKIHESAIYVIIWNEKNCCFSGFDKYQYRSMIIDELYRMNSLFNKENIKPRWLNDYQFEIIGNIFDNPELLTIKIE